MKTNPPTGFLQIAQCGCVKEVAVSKIQQEVCHQQCLFAGLPDFKHQNLNDDCIYEIIFESFGKQHVH